MNLPHIDLDLIPPLEGAQALFGAALTAAEASLDDRIVEIMVLLYEAMPPQRLV